MGAGRLCAQGLFLVVDAGEWDSSWQVGGGRGDPLVSFVGNELFLEGNSIVVLSKWRGLFL